MSRAITVRLAFGIVIFSFLCSLFIASIFSALDPSVLSGSPLGFFSYFALFVAQIFLVVPIVIFLRRNQMSLLENFRLNVITKRTVLLSMLLSFGTVMISSEINIIIDKIVPIPQSFFKSRDTAFARKLCFNVVNIYNDCTYSPDRRRNGF